mgnify:CR=1 FL=1|jgi:hypothetical protein
MIEFMSKELVYSLILFLFFLIAFMGHFPCFLLGLKLFRNKEYWKVVFAVRKESRFYLLFTTFIASFFSLLILVFIAIYFYSKFHSFLFYYILLIIIFAAIVLIIRLPIYSIKKINTRQFPSGIFPKTIIDNWAVQKILFDYPKLIALIFAVILVILGLIKILMPLF